MTGASAAAQRQSVLANNLANASTNGFRAELSMFRAVPLEGDGSSTRVFTVEATAGHLEQPGSAQRTDRPLDAMAQGNAYFAVQGLDGTEAYTRNGAFEVNSEGSLVTANGLTVLGDGGGPIVVPENAQPLLGSDGTVSVQIDGQLPISIGRLKLVTPTPENPIERSADGLFRAPLQGQLDTDATARVQTGALEGSNVNPIAAMVGMIQAARQFESQMRLVQTAEANDKAASQLLASR